MRRVGAIVAAATLAAASGCAAGGQEIQSWRGPSFAHQHRLIGEAQTFMADYSRLLLAGERAAIAALYDPDGAILVRNGRRFDVSRADLLQRYGSRNWQPPATFAWRDLHYEAVGAEAVVVIGEFAWGEGRGAPVIGTYHALLRREGDRLFIRIEDEWVPPSES